MKHTSKLTQYGQAVVGIQNNAKRLQAARQDSIAHLKKHGLYRLSGVQLKARLKQQKSEYYGDKYGVS